MQVLKNVSGVIASPLLAKVDPVYGFLLTLTVICAALLMIERSQFLSFSVYLFKCEGTVPLFGSGSLYQDLSTSGY